MSSVEYQILGDIIIMTMLSLFALALPGYWILRRRAPESGWNLGGNVSTSGIDSYDLLGVGAFACFVALMWKANGKFVGEVMPSPEISTVLGSALTYLTLAAIIPAALFWRVSLSEFFGLKWSKPLALLWIVPLLLLVMVGASEGLKLAGWNSWVDEIGGGRQMMVKALSTSGNNAFIAAVAFAVILAAPFAEETIFRGYLYPVVKRYTERGFATIFSGALFAVAHFNLLGLPLLFLFGVAMALIYERTGSLWAPIICHMIFNALQFQMMLGSEREVAAIFLF